MANVMNDLVCEEDGGGVDDCRSSRGSTSSWDFLSPTRSTPRDIASSGEHERLDRDRVESRRTRWVSTVGSSAGQTTVVRDGCGGCIW